MNINRTISIEKKRKELKQKLFHDEKEGSNSNRKGKNGAYLSDSSLEQPFPFYNEPNNARFPELVLLNRFSNKRPIFWFHSVGSVHPYFMLAENTERSFYGIEARGLRTNRTPLHGIQALAAYYIHIIMSVQSAGPYDLGGYSLGGLIAYEVTRQLQELGEIVASITMLDVLDTSVSGATQNISFKSRLLQGVNHTLATNIIQNPHRMKSLLINRNEVDWDMDEKKILKSLSRLAIERGSIDTEEEMQNKILRMAELQASYGYDSYSIIPLIRPDEVECYYFRNKSGILFGELSPFFWVIEDEGNVDDLIYWKLWEKNLPNIHMMNIDSSTHMMMLTEEKAYKPILEFCKYLYSEKGMSSKFLKTFKQKLGRKELA